jgi:hypothetical protein
MNRQSAISYQQSAIGYQQSAIGEERPPFLSDCSLTADSPLLIADS